MFSPGYRRVGDEESQQPPPSTTLRSPTSTKTRQQNLSSFRSVTSFDPAFICAQIVCLQCCLYSVFCCVMLVFDVLFGQMPSLRKFLDSDTLASGLSTATGMMVSLLYLLTVWLSGALLLVVIVKRAKKCLDFTATFIFWHFIVTCVAYGFPTSAVWWMLQLVCLILMAVTGEFFCMRRDSEPILLSNASASRRSTLFPSSPVTPGDIQMQHLPSLLRHDNASVRSVGPDLDRKLLRRDD